MCEFLLLDYCFLDLFYDLFVVNYFNHYEKYEKCENLTISFILWELFQNFFVVNVSKRSSSSDSTFTE